MVPRMADHPIPKLAEAVGDSTPSGPNIEENEATGLGNLSMKGGPPLRMNRQRILVARTLSSGSETKSEASNHCPTNRKLSTHSGSKIVRRGLPICISLVLNR
jgi:hypothetical protein